MSSQYGIVPVDKGALQINDKNATWRKIYPTQDNQVLFSDSSLDYGAQWRRIDQTNVACNYNLGGSVLTGDTNNWVPEGVESATVINVISIGNYNLTGIDKDQVPQCQLILYNSGNFNIMLRNDDAGSLPGNRFSLNPVQIALQPREAINLYYNHGISRWMAASHL